jgi:hypothetical protein
MRKNKENPAKLGSKNSAAVIASLYRHRVGTSLLSLLGSAVSGTCSAVFRLLSESHYGWRKLEND